MYAFFLFIVFRISKRSFYLTLRNKNPKVQPRQHQISPLDTIQSQFHSTPILIIYIPIYQNPILPSHSRSSKWFPHQHSVCIPRLPSLAICPAHCSLLDCTVLTTLHDLYKKLFVKKINNIPSCSITSSFLLKSECFTEHFVFKYA